MKKLLEHITADFRPIRPSPEDFYGERGRYGTADKYWPGPKVSLRPAALGVIRWVLFMTRPNDVRVSSEEADRSELCHCNPGPEGPPWHCIGGNSNSEKDEKWIYKFASVRLSGTPQLGLSFLILGCLLSNKSSFLIFPNPNYLMWRWFVNSELSLMIDRYGTLFADITLT